MSNEDVVREVLINRVFELILLIGGGGMFVFIGITAWWSVGMVRKQLGVFNLLMQMILQRLKDIEKD